LFKIYIFVFVLFSFLYADSVVPNDKQYYKHTQESLEIVYTQENLPYASHTLSLEESLNRDYEQSFDWKLDTTLFVGLISDHNQIANGFSSQWPRNRQINYLGGTQLIDTFCATSWLDLLLYHETAHNYQVNAKGHEVSQALHEVLGNGSLMFPFFIIPNVVESSFMLEGNAVLNESRHGNGGRLYSGRNKAQTIVMAQADKLTPQNLYNVSLDFPYYYDLWYIQGGFFHLYLAQNYGLDRVNRYFKEKTNDFYWPFLTNRSMEKALGVSFEEAVDNFASEYKKMGEKFVYAKGEKLASSKIFYQLNSDLDEIFFLTNASGMAAPELVVLEKGTKKIKVQKGAWLGGKVIKNGQEYLTQGSGYRSPFRIYQGLFDSEGSLRDASESKMVQGYLQNKEPVYFDVPSSYAQAKLYIGDTFYDTVHSSVFIDANDNLYYFKQNKKRRTLYKNKTPLYTYEGYYGIVSDVDVQGHVYFIASSQRGTSLYRVKEGRVERVHGGDNIVEAKLMDEDTLFLATLEAEGHSYILAKQEITQEAPYAEVFFFESHESEKKFDVPGDQNISLEHPYTPLRELHYGGTNLYAASDETATTGRIDVVFADPLMQNQASLYLFRDENNVTVSGVSYANSQYILSYMLGAYKTLGAPQSIKTRDTGWMAEARLPLYKSGYNEISLRANYYQDYEALERDPTNVTVTLARSYRYGLSMFPNYLQELELYFSRFDEGTVYGGRYRFEHDLPYEFYVGFEAKKSFASADVQEYTNGIKVGNVSGNVQFDPSRIHIPSFSDTYYFQEAGYVEAKITKVLNGSFYFFTFPLSLQREALYAKYRYYDLQYYDTKGYDFAEGTLGATFATVWFNKGVIPLSVEYVVNDADFLEEKYKIRFILELAF